MASESRLWKSRKAKPASQLSHSLDYYDFLTGYGIRILRARSIFGTPMADAGPMIFGQELEKTLVQCYQDAVKRFRKQERSEPLYVGFSLIGIDRKKFFFNVMSLALPGESNIRQNIFVSPEVLVDINEPDDIPFEKTLLPLVDTMWQVGGSPGTPCKRQGQWLPFYDFR